MSRLILVIAKVGISAGLLIFLYRNTPVSQIAGLVADINLSYLPAIGVLLFINTIISARKWQLFLKADGVVLSLWELTVSYMSGTFCNLFLPSNIGGDTYRVYDIARQSKQGARSAASVFADRFSGFIALVSLSLCSSFYVAYQFGSAQFIIAPLILFLTFLLVLVLLVKQQPMRRVIAFFRLDRIDVIERMTNKLFLSFSIYGSNRRLLINVMFLSFCFQFSVITVVYLMARALGVSIDYLYFSAFVPLITLMEALPISIYGIGVRDYGYVLFFTQVGMGEIATRTLALFFMSTAIVYSLIGGLFLLYRLWRHPRGQEQRGVR